MKRQGILFALIGASGSGKTSIAKQILDNDTGTKFSVSVTSRALRVGEIDGVHYHFVSRTEFEQKIAQGEFFEHEEVHGNLYGTLRATVDQAITDGQDLILDIDVAGALNFKKRFPHNTVIAFISPVTRQQLLDRLQGRGQISADEFARRLRTAEREYARLLESVESSGAIDYFVLNDRFESALELCKAILAAERSRIQRLDRTALQALCDQF
jgi:guanylate kinase